MAIHRDTYPRNIHTCTCVHVGAIMIVAYSCASLPRSSCSTEISDSPSLRGQYDHRRSHPSHEIHLERKADSKCAGYILAAAQVNLNYVCVHDIVHFNVHVHVQWCT